MSSSSKKRGRSGGPRGSAGGGAGQGSSAADRSLRQKSDKALYLDGIESDSDEETHRQTFDVIEKLQSAKFPQYFVREMIGDDVNVGYFQKSGFSTPIVVRERTGLQMTVPDMTFTVTDVKNAVGARRLLDVMDCNTQRNTEMNMKEWEEYYNNPNRDSRRLNVISLEFSLTKLDPYVIAPKVVRQVDWVNNVWPRHLKEQQVEGTNDIREMKYPKVQKYCLMSVGSCYTDFHIDFGGTSVWYHIVKGAKVFWLIPPTEVNLKAYEQWTLSGKQSNVFFGDLVEKCGRIRLDHGNTFLIPSGWIHAVYTPEDSLVFGGNFLHSFAIEKQIRVAQIEEITKVPQKFRFPFFTELQWFAMDKYVYHLLGRSHLDLTDELSLRLFGSDGEQKQHETALSSGNKRPHLTPQEIFGLKAIVMYIHALAVSKKNVPQLISEPIELVRDIRLVVDEHKNDELDSAVTGVPLLHWPGIKTDPGFTRLAKPPKPKKDTNRLPSFLKNEQKSSSSSAPSHLKKERVPCNICQACISPDCGRCHFCMDMPRFGGAGKLRQPCQLRLCLQPLLLPTIVCNICNLDGWFAETNLRLIDRPPGTCALMECCLCHEVTHPGCVTDKGVEGYVKMELPNSWECPTCVKNGDAVKPEVKTEEEIIAAGGVTPSKMIKLSNPQQQGKRAMTYGADSTYTGHQLFSVQGRSDQSKQELRTQLATQILSASTQPQKEPAFVFRPPPMQLSAEEIYERREDETVDLLMERGIMLDVFARLNTVDLSNCVLVCKAWTKIVQDPALWNSVKLSHKKITSHFLSLIVQRQPTKLILDWAVLGKQQLTWLLPRIPQTRTFSLSGLEYNSSVVALGTVNCPMLQELDLSYVTNFNDNALFKLLSSPKDSRPGLLDKKSRLKLLRRLNLAGTEISDVGLRYITQFLMHLQNLSVSGCWKVTDAGLAQLSTSDARTIENLTHMDVSSCRGVSNAGLAHLSKCKELVYVNCVQTSITTDAMRKFADGSPEKLKVQGSVIQRRLSRK